MKKEQNTILDETRLLISSTNNWETQKRDTSQLQSSSLSGGYKGQPVDVGPISEKMSGPIAILHLKRNVKWPRGHKCEQYMRAK